MAWPGLSTATVSVAGAAARGAAMATTSASKTIEPCNERLIRAR